MTESELIHRLSRKIKTDHSVIVGIGDDAAVLRYQKDRYLLLTTDMVIEGVHFSLGKATPFEIGWKAMAVNLSDIAAMGGVPRWAVVSLAGPFKEGGRWKVEKFVWEIYRGMNTVGKKFGVHIVGGDTDRATKWTINIALLGEVEKKYVKLRSGAKVGDQIFVTGRLGGSIYGRHLSFMPRIKEGRYLVTHYPLTSMIDLSDGLASDLRRILEQSKAGALIYERQIPLSPRAKSVQNAFCDGEDFELLFTLPKHSADKLNSKNIPWISHIGEVTKFSQGLRIQDRLGRIRPIPWRGYEHF